MYGRSSQQFVESMNWANSSARFGLDLFSAIYNLVTKESKRYNKNRNEFLDSTSTITLYAKRRLDKVGQRAASVIVQSVFNATSGLVLAGSSHISYRVDISDERFSCECGAPAVTSLPCKHQLAFANKKGVAHESLICGAFKRSRWLQQYALESFQVPSISEVKQQTISLSFVLKYPTQRPRTVGRPKRQKSGLEDALLANNKPKRAFRCTKCFRMGHSVATHKRFLNEEIETVQQKLTTLRSATTTREAKAEIDKLEKQLETLQAELDEA
jgi:hypothetical protein